MNDTTEEFSPFEAKRFEQNVVEMTHRLCGRDRYHHGPFLVDERALEVECKKCGEKLNPVKVLADLSDNHRLWEYRRREIEKAKEKLEARKVCRCQNCGKMTKIQKGGENGW